MFNPKGNHVTDMSKGRPIRHDSKLGRMMLQRQLRSYEFAAFCGFSPIILTEYLAIRSMICNEDLMRFVELLGCKAEDLIEPELDEDVTDCTGRPLKKTGAKVVADLEVNRIRRKAQQRVTNEKLPSK